MPGIVVRDAGIGRDPAWLDADLLELSTEDDVADAVLRFADMRRLRFAKKTA